MPSTLLEAFEQAALTPAAPRTHSGSPVDLDLRVLPNRRIPQRIDIVKALRDGGITLKESFDTMNRLLETCHERVHLPAVEHLPTLIDYLEQCEVDAEPVAVAEPQHAPA